MALPRFCRQRTELGTCRPVVTWKLPHHTWGPVTGEGSGQAQEQSQPPAPPPPRRGRVLTVKAGSTGCVNLALNVCTSCLVRAL